MATATSSSIPNDSTGISGPISTGVGPSIYYGSIALALFVICAITVVSRVFFLRKQRRLVARRNQVERQDLERRGEDPGLPTYHESRAQNSNLPSYTLTYAPPATSTGPGRLIGSDPNVVTGATAAPSPSPAESAHHFHFHFPSFPAALHLRPSNATDLASSSADHTFPPPPAYANAPPKYDPAAASNTTLAPAITEIPSRPSSPPANNTEASAPVQSEEEMSETRYEEFVHPEERRRNEEARRREEGFSNVEL